MSRTTIRSALAVIALVTAVAPLHGQRRRVVGTPPLPAPCRNAVLAEASTATVVTDANFVYYGDWATQGVYRVPKDGGAVQTLVMLPDVVVTLMAIDDDHIYVAARPQGEAIKKPADAFIYSIYEISKTGGSIQTLAEGISLPKQLAVDDEYVYWVSLGTVV